MIQLMTMKRSRKDVARAVAGNATVLALFIGGGGSVAAQEMIQPALTLPSQEAAEQSLKGEPREGLFKLAMFDIHPRVGGSVYYDDNINIQPADLRTEDVVWTVSPGLAAIATDGSPGEGAKSLRLEYVPTLLFYTHNSSENTVNHVGNLAAVWPFAKLTLGLTQTAYQSTGPVIDVGGRTEQTLLGTAVTAHYAIGEKSSVEVNGGLNVSDYSRYTSSWDWSNQDWFNYQIGSKLGLGLGVVLGYVDLKGASDQNYEEGLVRAVYLVAEKVSLNASVGADWRQYRGGAPDALNPVWNLGASYRPWDRTTLTLGLYQRFSSSAIYADQNYLGTGANLSLRQEVFKRLSLNFAGSYYHADYKAIDTTVQQDADRRDDVLQLRASVDYQILEHWYASVFYAFETDQSNLDVYTFRRNQVGFQTTWSF
jgi:hypothetical protein